MIYYNQVKENKTSEGEQIRRKQRYEKIKQSKLYSNR